MPSWAIHLKVGKEINKKLKANNDEFMFGSLVPDTDSDWKLSRFKAHYYGNLKFPKCPCENMIDIDEFLKDYKEKLNNPLIIGYYCHILTDNFYNEYIYYNKWIKNENNDVIGIKKIDGTIIDVSDDYTKTLKYKHKDLELYGKRIFNCEKLYIPKDISKINNSICLLTNNFINLGDVKKRIDYLNDGFVEFNRINDFEMERKYELFTKEELDKLLNDCINYIIKELKKVGIINE